MDKRIQVNSIIQVNENGQKRWISCLIQVSELKTWGIQGWAQIPMQGSAYIRLKWDQIDYIGEAIMRLKEEENDN